MTRHGGQKVLKRLNAAKHIQIKRKHGKFFVNPSPGPHKKDFCLPLVHIIRDLLKIVDNHREAKKLIAHGYFKVDGKIIKDAGYPVGFMDVLTIEKTNKHYRILPDYHYGLILHEIPEKESLFKLCRIDKKTIVKGGHLQLNLHDGKNILIKVKNPQEPKEDTYARMGVVKISIPDQEIIKYLEFKEGKYSIIMDGKNIGQVGQISEIKKRFGPNASTVSIKHDGELIETLYDYTFIIGEKESEISLPEN